MSVNSRIFQEATPFKPLPIPTEFLKKHEIDKTSRQNKAVALGDHRSAAPEITKSALKQVGQDSNATKASETSTTSKSSFKNFIASTSLGKLFSTDSKIGKLYAANQKQKEDFKQIASVQKEIDVLVTELKSELNKLKDAKNDTAKAEIKGKIDSLHSKISLNADAITTKNATAKVFIEIAQGKAKVVSMEWSSYEKSKNLNNKKLEEGEKLNVYYTPVGSNFIEKMSKKAEIQEEVVLGKEFGEKMAVEDAKLKKLGIEPEEEKYVAFSMDPQKNVQDKKGGKEYTVKTDAAMGGDLDGAKGEKGFPFPESAKIGLDILKGMNNLHKAGYVHGDVKGDNVLIVINPDGSKLARVADLGKTRKMEPNEKGINVGNPRYAAPEGGSSHRSEVFSTALLIISSLEGKLLTKDNGYMILSDKNFEKDESVKPEERRKGIEKFLVMNKNCPQTENTSFQRKATILGREIVQNLKAQLGVTSHTINAQKEVHKYIDALVTELIKKNPESKNQINELGNLLKEMTRSKLDGSGEVRTASLQDAMVRYEAIMSRLQ